MKNDMSFIRKFQLDLEKLLNKKDIIVFYSDDVMEGLATVAKKSSK